MVEDGRKAIQIVMVKKAKQAFLNLMQYPLVFKSRSHLFF
jgi:hypothetical protein